MRISDWSSDVCSSDLLGGGLLHHLRARIVILVHAVAEAHQPERIVLVFRAGDIFGDAIGGADLVQHVERGLVGAAVRGPPQTGDTGRDARERVRSEEHTSELQSLMRNSYAVFCLKK